MNENNLRKNCVRCSFELSANTTEACFCPKCGWDQRLAFARGRFKLKHLGFVCLGSLALFGAVRVIELQVPLGEKPTKKMLPDNGDPSNSDSARPRINHDDTVLLKLKQSVKDAPNDLEPKKAYAQAVLARIQESETLPSELVFELIDTYREILNIDPKNAEALLGMADASFNSQVVDKAAEYYVRYLAIKPEDDGARLRYGSALTLMQRFKEAETELLSVLKKDPSSFAANAYLAITYQSQGDEVRAKEIYQAASLLAPNEQSKTDLADILNKIKADQSKSARVSADPSVGSNIKAGETKNDSNEEVGQDLNQAIEKLVSEIILSNSVAGPKFNRVEKISPNTLAVYMNDFPMDKMPPFVKQKFLDRVKENLLETGKIKKSLKLVFTDTATQKEMETLVVQ